jgi:NAD-dependent DNA ligase
MSTLRKIKVCEAGTYYSYGEKVILLSDSALKRDAEVKAFRTYFEEEYWPIIWFDIKLTRSPIPWIEEGFINSPPSKLDRLVEDSGDLYFLTKADLLRVEGIQDTLAEKLLIAIENSKTRPIDKVITALGVRHVGREWGRKLGEIFGTVDNLSKASWEDLVSIKDLGATISHSIIEFFRTESNCKMVEKLRLAGIKAIDTDTVVENFINQDKTPKEIQDFMDKYDNRIKAPNYDKLSSKVYTRVETGRLTSEVPSIMEIPKSDPHWTLEDQIKGKVFMFTGRLNSMTRDQARELVESKGGIAGVSLTKDTNYLVVGDTGNREFTNKLGLATVYGTKKITEEEFLSLLEES